MAACATPSPRPRRPRNAASAPTGTVNENIVSSKMMVRRGNLPATRTLVSENESASL